METPEEAAASDNFVVNDDNNDDDDNNNNSSECPHAITKRKRTKRQRLLLLPPAPAASPASSSEFSGTTTDQEEEDMANCLILLAQGRARDPAAGHPKPERRPAAEEAAAAGEKFTSRRYAEATTTTNGKVGFYVYECKTCNKCFPSFQALGGHRASHKKPKLTTPAADEKKAVVVDDNSLQISMNSFAKSATAHPAAAHNTGNSPSSNKARVHECSICGSEFSSGQALGGHMRRHRPIAASDAAAASAASEGKKERNVLSLDLNLPAPSDDVDHGEFPKSPSSSAVAFPFESKQPLLFSASALVVDCHY